MKDGYAICLNEWALDKEIKNELGLLLIISSLTAEKGYCYASNKCLSEMFEEPEQTISRKIKKLEEKGYITIEYTKEGYRVTQRTIRLTKMLTADKQECESPINKNVKENITSIYNIYPPNPPEGGDTITENEKLNHNFGILWDRYPKKEGKANAFKYYKSWLVGRKTPLGKIKLTNEEMLDAINRYNDQIEERRTEYQYIKQGSTFFCSGILDFLQDEDDADG